MGLVVLILLVCFIQANGYFQGNNTIRKIDISSTEFMSLNSANSAINTTTSMDIPSIHLEKQKVQINLVNLLKEAHKIGVEIPEVTGFDEPNNGIVYVRLVVNNSDIINNSENKMANASEFSIQYTYPYGVGFTNTGDDVGVFIRIPEGTYSIRGMDVTSFDEERNAFLNSFMTAWDAGCEGNIQAGELKECTLTKFH